jgi:hypothetical protein
MAREKTGRIIAENGGAGKCQNGVPRFRQTGRVFTRGENIAID